jgi:glycosyltransferase involved in cell wall biosynthesis
MERTDRLLVVVIPAYNEEARIGDTITSLRSHLPEVASMGFETRILVVDDGSSDATRRIADGAGVDQIVRHRVNQGLGAAVRSGLEAAFRAGADIAVKFDADLQHDPSDIGDLVRPILDDEADIVYGNRFERIDYEMPLHRRWGNRVFTRLMRWLTGWPIRDGQPGIFAVDRVYLERFHIPGDYNYTQQILLDAYHKGMRFASVPVSFRKRETGRSFVSFRYPFKVLPQIFWLLVGVRPMRIFGTIGGLFIAIATAVMIWDYWHFLDGSYSQPIQHVNAVLGTGLLGLQTFFFGVLAQLIVRNPRR